MQKVAGWTAAAVLNAVRSCYAACTAAMAWQQWWSGSTASGMVAVTAAAAAAAAPAAASLSAFALARLRHQDRDRASAMRVRWPARRKGSARVPAKQTGRAVVSFVESKPSMVQFRLSDQRPAEHRERGARVKLYSDRYTWHVASRHVASLRSQRPIK